MIDTPDAFASTHTEEAAFSSDRWQARLTGCSATFIAVVDNIDVGLISGAQWQDGDGFAGLFQMATWRRSPESFRCSYNQYFKHFWGK